MFLIEKVNFEVAQKIKLMSYSQFVQIFEKSTTKRHNDYDLRSEFSKLKNYTTKMVKSQNNLKVEYGFVEGKDFGRLQSKTPSIQRLYNGFRGILCDGLTYDLDMNNCHPNIIMNLCKKHKISCLNIQKYIENREPYLKAVMDELNISRSEAKSLYLKCVNKEEETTKYGKRTIKNRDFLDFDKETSNIINALYDIYKKEYNKYIKESEYNYKGKMVNLLLCKIENEYLQRALEYLKSNSIIPCTLMFDGCMIYKGDYDIKKVIKDLDRLFKKDNIKWSIKEHNIELLTDLNALKLKDIDYYVANDIIELAEYILNNTLNDRIFRHNGIIYLITNNKLSSNSNDIHAYLYNMFSNNEYYLKDGEKEKIISKNHSQLNSLVECVINKVETSEKDFLNEIWDETQFKLFYKNGYYDFKQNKFIKSNNAKTFVRIEKDFSEVSNETIKNEIYNKILYPIFSITDKKKDTVNIQLMNNFLYNISRAIAGHIEDKQWLLMQGLRDCGKGVISSLLKECFTDYINFTNVGNFIAKNLNTDSAKSLSWMIDYQFKRLAITQEISIQDKQEIDGALIKKFCSGGDYLQARKNNKDEMEFKIQASLMICCNDFPEISPTDTMEFCREYQIKSKFVADDFSEEKKLNTFSYFKANPTIKDFIKRTDIINEFTKIIIEAYNNKVEYPKQIKQELEAVEEDEDGIKLFNLFEFTNDKDDYISNDDLRDSIKAHKIVFALKKCKILLKTRGAQDYRSSAVRGLNFIKFKN